MADFNDIKKYAAEKAAIIVDKTKEVAKTAADMTKTAAKITKLKAEIAGEKDSVRKNFAVLGEKFYEAHKDNPPEGFEQIFAEITVSYGVIQSKNEEINTLSNSEESGIQKRKEAGLLPGHILRFFPNGLKMPDKNNISFI